MALAIAFSTCFPLNAAKSEQETGNSEALLFLSKRRGSHFQSSLMSKETDKTVRTPSEVYQAVLSKHVQGVRFDYKSLKNEPDALNSYLEWVSQQKVDDFSLKEELAFIINAYNAYTLKAVIDHYPISGSRKGWPSNSIGQIPGVWKKWKIRVAGKDMTLDELEHRWIRSLDEPRIHFGVNCASIGCPPLRKEVFRASELEVQLEEQTSEFLASNHGLRFTPVSRELGLSKLFEWFHRDFEGEATPWSRKYGKFAGVVGFVSKYLKPSLVYRLKNEVIKVSFFDYDWGLNEVVQSRSE